MDNPVRNLMTVREMAQYLKLGEWAIYRLVARGQLPVQRIGRTIRFDLSEVKAWIAEGKTVKAKS